MVKYNHKYPFLFQQRLREINNMIRTGRPASRGRYVLPLDREEEEEEEREGGPQVKRLRSGDHWVAPRRLRIVVDDGVTGGDRDQDRPCPVTKLNLHWSVEEREVSLCSSFWDSNNDVQLFNLYLYFFPHYDYWYAPVYRGTLLAAFIPVKKVSYQNSPVRSKFSLQPKLNLCLFALLFWHLMSLNEALGPLGSAVGDCRRPGRLPGGSVWCINLK